MYTYIYIYPYGSVPGSVLWSDWHLIGTGRTSYETALISLYITVLITVVVVVVVCVYVCVYIQQRQRQQ